MPEILPRIAVNLKQSIESLHALRDEMEQIKSDINPLLFSEVEYLLNRLNMPQILWAEHDEEESERESIYKYALEQAKFNQLKIKEDYMQYNVNDQVLLKDVGSNKIYAVDIDYISRKGDVRVCVVRDERCFTLNTHLHKILGHIADDKLGFEDFIPEEEIDNYLQKDEALV